MGIEKHFPIIEMMKAMTRRNNKTSFKSEEQNPFGRRCMPMDLSRCSSDGTKTSDAYSHQDISQTCGEMSLKLPSVGGKEVYPRYALGTCKEEILYDIKKSKIKRIIKEYEKNISKTYIPIKYGEEYQGRDKEQEKFGDSGYA